MVFYASVHSRSAFDDIAVVGVKLKTQCNGAERGSPGYNWHAGSNCISTFEQFRVRKSRFLCSRLGLHGCVLSSRRYSTLIEPLRVGKPTSALQQIITTPAYQPRLETDFLMLCSCRYSCCRRMPAGVAQLEVEIAPLRKLDFPLYLAMAESEYCVQSVSLAFRCEFQKMILPGLAPSVTLSVIIAACRPRICSARLQESLGFEPGRSNFHDKTILPELHVSQVAQNGQGVG